MFKKYSEENIYLLIGLSITGYTLIIPGLTFIDIFAVVIFVINIKKLTKVSIFSWVILLTMSYQLILNIFYYTNNLFAGSFLSTIIPVLHKYIPLLLIMIVIENIIINTKPFLEKYRNALFVILSLFIISKLFVIVANVPSIKSVAFTTGLSAVVAILTPYWFVVYNKSMINMNALIILVTSLMIIVISEIRGSLIMFFILLLCGAIPILKRKLFLVLSPLIALLLFGGVSLIRHSEKLMSIVNLQLGMIFNLNIDISLLTSSERVRYTLWTSAKEVWENNFFFGIGTNQFKTLNVLADRDIQLSPHHAIYSSATDGGVIAVFLLLLPALIIIFKNHKNKTRELYWLKVNSAIYIICAFMFGYTLNMYIVIAMYIAYSSIMDNDKLLKQNPENKL